MAYVVLIDTAVRSAPRARVVRFALVASALVVGAKSTRADTLAPPGMVAPSPSAPHKILPSWLEADVHSGIAEIVYVAGQLDEIHLTGASWFVDAELGWRHGRWSVSGFASYLYHPDHSSDSFGGGGDTWNVRLHVIELGVRGTLHLERWSLGAGIIPAGFARAWGSDTLYLQTAGPCPPGLVPYSFRQTSWEIRSGGELHVAYALSVFAQLPLEVVGHVEYTHADEPGKYPMAAVGIGIGAKL